MVGIETIQEITLCNLLPYGNYSIIDTRPASLYEENAIFGSISCPPPENLDSLDPSLITIDWISENCIPPKQHEKFAWISLLKTVLAGDTLNDPWINCLYDVFLAAKFKYKPEFVSLDGMRQRYPLLFAPRGESVTFKKFRYPSEILPNFLWLGSVESAQDRRLIQSLNITHIVNATIRSRRNFFPENVKYFVVDVLDEVSEDLTKHFTPVNDFINEAERENGRVLVHCQAGISRSASLVIDYVRQRNQWTLKESLEYVMKQRPEVHPNRSFMIQLMNQERLSCDGRSSLQIEDVGAHGGVKDSILSRMTSSNSTMSVETLEKSIVSDQLNEPLVSPPSPSRGSKSNKKSGDCCRIL